MSEVGGGNGSERRPPPGIQAQRPSPSHRTHDTTDQWRDRFQWLGRTEAQNLTLRVLHEIPSRASGELLEYMETFFFILAWNYKGFVEYMERTWRVHGVFWLVLVRNHIGFVVDMDSLVHFSLQIHAVPKAKP